MYISFYNNIVKELHFIAFFIENEAPTLTRKLSMLYIYTHNENCNSLPNNDVELSLSLCFVMSLDYVH